MQETGQASTQAPHSVQASALTTTALSDGISSTLVGQAETQAPHPMQASASILGYVFFGI
jgi:hypothetical protein